MVQSDVRIMPLDGLRGIAAVMVLVWHLTGGMMDRSSGWGEAVYAATIFGRSGVDLFFVLSGFLIIGILVDQRNSYNIFKIFYIRRACRILPAYVTLLILYWFIFLILGASSEFNNDGFPYTFIAQLTFMWNVLMSWTDGPIAKGFSITWSVDIEEHFYLIFPTLIWFCPREKIARLLILTGLASWAGRAGFHLAYPEWINPPYMFTPFRLDGLCAGGLLAIGYRNDAIRALAEKYRAQLRTAAVIAAGSIPFAVSGIRNDLFWHMYLWGHAYLTAAYALIIAAVLFNVDRFNFLSSIPFRLAGRYSYGLYLFHPLFLSVSFIIYGQPELVTTWQEAAVTAASLVATFAFCALLFETIERRFQGFGHRYQYRGERHAKVLKPAE